MTSRTATASAMGTLPDVSPIDIEGFEIAASTPVAQTKSLLRRLNLRALSLTGQLDPLAGYGQVRSLPME